MNRKKVICTALLAFSLIGESIFAGAAPRENIQKRDEVVYDITSAEEFFEFAGKCKDSSWSYKKSFRLTNDIELGPDTLINVPFFSGDFDGGGHTIGGLLIDDKNARGSLFTETSRNASIHDLSVRGSLVPSGAKEKIGGIVSVNSGKITCCSFKGSIESDTVTGGIAGHNTSSGRIQDCNVSGSVEGINEVGGLAGLNEGIIRKSISYSSVNASQREEEISEDRLNSIVEHIKTTGDVNSLRNTSVITDVGGIAGLNKGTISECRNTGTVGYKYVGYNVGGITGRSSGFLSDNENNGDVFGRKDVGGITGQLSPYLEVEFAKDDLEQLKSMLGELSDDVVKAEGNTKKSNLTVTTKLGELSDILESAGSSARKVADGSLSYADALTDQTNANGKALDRSVKAISKTMKSLQKSLNDLEKATDTLVKETQSFIDEAKLSDSDRKIAEDALDSLQSGMEQISSSSLKLQKSVTKMSKDMDDLQKAIDSSGVTADKTAMYTRTVLNDTKDIYKYTSAISKALNNDLIPAANRISVLLETKEGEAGKTVGPLKEALTAFTAATGEVAKQTSELVTIINDASNSSSSVADFFRNLEDNKEQLSQVRSGSADALLKLSDASINLGTAVNNFINAVTLSDDERKKLKDDNDIIRSATSTIATNGALLDTSIGKLLDDLDKIQKDIDDNTKSAADAKKALEAVKADADGIVSNTTDIMEAIDKQILPATESILELAKKYSGGPDNKALRDAVKQTQNAVNAMPDSLNSLADIMDDLLDNTDRVLPKLDVSVRDSAEDLFQSMIGADKKLGELASSLADTTDQVTTDLQGITKKFNKCMDIMIDAVNLVDKASTDPLEHVEDLSREEMSRKELDSLRQGRITKCVNIGKVKGSLDLGGIAGTMGIESDLDPEDDIANIGGKSSNYAFRSKCIIDECVSRGDISVRKNNAGGICGQMNLGQIYECQSYADTASDTGSYIGGIAGFSKSAVRSCYAKCNVSGMRYIGGIAGYGSILSNNTAMVRIPAAEQEYGAIAGDVEKREDDQIYGNRFVAEDESYRSEYRKDETYGADAGINGTSFTGMAEEMSYEDLYNTKGIPVEFKELRLTFRVDGNVVTTLTCAYGDTIQDTDIPQIPQREGYTGEWDRESFAEIKGDDTINAVYSVKVDTLASSELRDKKQSILLVEGSFSRNDELIITAREKLGDEVERWHVESPGNDVCTYHFLPPEGRYSYTIDRRGSRKSVSTETFGRYVTFSAEGPEFDIIVTQKSNTPFIVSIVIAFLLLVTAGIVIWKKKNDILTLISLIRRYRRARKAARKR